MVTEYGHTGAQPSASFVGRVFRWAANLLRQRKTHPCISALRQEVQVPRCDLERLSEISPHLLADIGVKQETAAGETSPWRLDDGRHLLLRPPL